MPFACCAHHLQTLHRLSPYHITLRGANPTGAPEGLVAERDLSVVQVMRLLGQQLPDAKAWAALALALLAGMVRFATHIQLCLV